MFVDKAKIHIKAGNGGDGAVAFHREKYVASGGPDGGDGGRGGNIVFQVDDNISTLADFRYKRKYTAQNRENGRGSRCNGKKAPDLIIKVPRGTVIREVESGVVMADMSSNEPFIAAKGGNGGWGNSHFATPTRQTPRFAKSGAPGEEWEVSLELKLIADVGLLGFPKTSSGVPSSSITPFAIKITLSATPRAKFISCVTTIIVRSLLFSSRITRKTSPVSSGSSAEVGSSKQSISGLSASARAIATRCCCPPDRLHG